LERSEDKNERSKKKTRWLAKDTEDKNAESGQLPNKDADKVPTPNNDCARIGAKYQHHNKRQKNGGDVQHRRIFSDRQGQKDKKTLREKKRSGEQRTRGGIVSMLRGTEKKVKGSCATAR